MTFALQSMSEGRNLQSATAPAREPLGLEGLGRPRAKQVRTCRRSGPGLHYTARAPNSQHLVPSVRLSGTLYWGESPQVSGPPHKGNPAPRRKPSHGSGLTADVSRESDSRRIMGLGEQSFSDALHETTTGIRHRQMPYRGGNPHFRNLIQNQSLTLSKAQANYALFPLPSRCRRRNEGDSLRIAQSTTVHVLRKDRLQ